jgi:hypothetical protein
MRAWEFRGDGRGFWGWASWVCGGENRGWMEIRELICRYATNSYMRDGRGVLRRFGLQITSIQLHGAFSCGVEERRLLVGV